MEKLLARSNFMMNHYKNYKEELELIEEESKKFNLYTLKPGFVSNIDGKAQSPHILISISSRGLNMTLNTRIYFEGDDLINDPLLSTIKNSRNDISSLVAKKIDEDIYLFDIFLQGENETIFLDI